MLILNTAATKLPSGKPLTHKEKVTLGELQRRKHLEYRDKDRDLDPLDAKEQERCLELETKWNDERPPKWGPIEIAFAAFGEPGCLWELRADVAMHYVSQHPRRLKRVQHASDLDELAKKVKDLNAFPVQQIGRYPSKGELGFGVDNLKELSANPLRDSMYMQIVDDNDGDGVVSLGAGWQSFIRPAKADVADL